MSLSISLSRRLVLKAGASIVAAAAAPRLSFAQQGADFVLISLADLHSPYAQLPRLLAQARGIVAAAGVPARILINGDIFERGNVVALRSKGAADFAFLKALAAIAPTAVNWGNHETALIDDPAEVRNALSAASIFQFSSLLDARTGEPYLPPAWEAEANGRRVAILGVGTDQMMTYRAPARGLILAPQPAAYAAHHMASSLSKANGLIVVSHAGVQADKAILAAAPARTLLIGGHDHLRLDSANDKGSRLFHSGSWGNHLRVVSVHLRGNDGPRFEVVEQPLGAAADPTLAAEIARQQETHLTAEDRAEIASLPRALDLAEAALVATEAVRKAANADVALLNHTSFGDGLPAGAVSKYRFDSFLRFDGDVRVATLDGATLAAILRGANQHKAASIDARTGDFVYANELAIDASARYRVAANGWTTLNQQTYLGRTGLTFEAVPGVMVKATVAKALTEFPR